MMTNRLPAPAQLCALALCIAACSGSSPSPAAAPHAHAGSMHAMGTWTGPFVASSDRSFDDQMTEAMARMHDGMSSAPTTGDPDRDFVAMMLPHHQGAVDMAKVLLVHGKDAEMHRLAQEIITDQQNEIELMQLWYKRHGAGLSAPTDSAVAARSAAVAR